MVSARATATYVMVMRGVGRRNRARRHQQEQSLAEADDISCCPFCKSTEVKSGEYSDLVSCRVMVVAAGRTKNRAKDVTAQIAHKLGID